MTFMKTFFTGLDLKNMKICQPETFIAVTLKLIG